MYKILITGASGFVGANLIGSLNENLFSISKMSLRNQNPKVAQGIQAVIHLAGKAHDLKKISNEKEYFIVNTELTTNVYKEFCQSKAEVFIFISSIKAVSDRPFETVTEEIQPNPQTAYGKSKLAAEEYLLKHLKQGTRLYILRPCMIHGPGNKGNLNLLYKIVKKGFPYPLGSFINQRSYLSIDNLSFVINELLLNTSIPSGVYNVADDQSFSTTEVVKLIGKSMNKKVKVAKVPKTLIKLIAKLGDILKLPLTPERLQKLTEDYIVSNVKIKKAMGKPLPVKGEEGLLKTFESFRQ